MTGSRQKLRALVLVSVVVFSAVLVGTAMTGSVAAAGNTATPLIEISDFRQTNGGNLEVVVNATSTTEVTDLTFWYELLSGGSLGPVDRSSSAVLNAYYKDGSPFAAGDPVASDIHGGKVIFTFDSSGTDWVYRSAAFRVNVTGYDTSYANADAANRSTATANFYQISANDHDGNALSNIPLLLTNATNNASKGFAFLPGTSVSFDCVGVGKSGDCIDPETGAYGQPQSDVLPEPRTAPISLSGFSLSNANASKRVDPTVGSTTLTVDQPTAPTFMLWRSALEGGSSPTVNDLTIVNASSGTVIYRASSVGSQTNAPVLLRTNTEYTVSLENSATFGTENRSLLIPTKGMSNVQFKIETSGLSTSKVTGQVINGSSGDPIGNAIVMAQPEFAGGNSIQIYNSTTTDSNGLFTMSLPQTDELGSQYGFRLIGTDTSGDTLIYYPTTDTNDGDGYVAPSSQTIIPPMEIDPGGRVDISVTTGGQKNLPINTAFTSLSQESTAFPSTERTAVSNGFSTFAFGGNKPSSASVALMSPTTGSETSVFYNVWGGSTEWLCANQVSVSQGSATSSTCTVEKAGYLNLSLVQYESIIQQSTQSKALVQTNSFFFENELLIRDATTGNVVTHLGPDGIQQFLLSGDENTRDLSIPLPAGDYAVELRPTRDFAPLTSVNETAATTVTADSTTDLQLDRGGAFPARPIFSRFDTSLKRSGKNTFAVEVRDPVSGTTLTDSEVSVTIELLHLNGTTATEPVDLTFNSSSSVFDTTDFIPSNYGVDAGRYRGLLTVTHTDGSRIYNSTFSGPLEVTGFDTALSLGARSIGPGNSLDAQIRAYNDGQGVDAAAEDIDIQLLNENGQVVKSTNPTSDISSGTGSFSLTMPDTPGRYRLSVTVSSAESQGIAQQWIEVQQFELDVSTDRRTYAPSDTVTVTAEASDATDGSAVADATISLRVNGQRVTTSTDSDGIATVKLDPETYASESTWQRGQGISVTLTKQTETGVIRKSDGTFFEVRRFSARAEPTQESFSQSESAVLRVTVPSRLTVNSVSVTELDGEQVTIGGNSVTNVADGVYTVDLGTQSIGRHIATVTVETGSGTETATTPFRVQQYAISTSLNGRTFDAGENVEVMVAVREPGTGNAVESQSVSADLNATNPIRTVDSASDTTDSNGEATMTLSSSEGGPHFVEVTVGEQTRRLGLVVSDISAHFEDSSGNQVTTYEATPGSTSTVYVDATKDGSAVADGSTVEAAAITRDGAVPHGTADTSGGVASIDFTIPSSVPAREYSLVARVLAGQSTGIARGTLNVTGSTAKGIQATTNRSALSPGEAVEYWKWARPRSGWSSSWCQPAWNPVFGSE